STSSSMLRRPMATIRPRPTTTSDAAIAITAIAKTCPSSCPACRENAIRARFAPFSMISTLSRMINGLRRTSTPSAPVTNRIPESDRYQAISGPCTDDLLDPLGLSCLDGFDRAGVRAEHDAADRGDEQHDRGDLEREQVIGQEQRPDRRGRAERARDVRRVA